MGVDIQGESLERTGTLQSAAVATGNGTVFDCKGLAILALQVVGPFTGTIAWEGTVDGTNWVALEVMNRIDFTIATTASAVGLYLANVVGLSFFRARVSAWGSGTITVTARASTVGIALGALGVAVTPQFDDTDKQAVSLYARGAAAGDSELYVESAAQHNLRVALFAGANLVPSALLSADAAAAAAYALRTHAAGYLFNGDSWDRQRGNVELTLLASAARTETTVSPNQVNYNHVGLVLQIRVTVVTDTPSVTPLLQIVDPISGFQFTVWTAAAPLTAVGDTAYLFMPGGAAGSYTEAVNLRVTRTWRISMVHADSDSITYSVSANLLV